MRLTAFWTAALAAGVTVGTVLSFLISQAILDHNPQGVFCNWQETTDWTSSDWTDRCTLTGQYFIYVAVAFGYGFIPIMLMATSIWFVRRLLRR